MKWITREHIKVDRVACSWLIRRFINPDAQFLFVDEGQLVESAAPVRAVVSKRSLRTTIFKPRDWHGSH